MRFWKKRKPEFESIQARNLIVLNIGTQVLKALFLEVDTKQEKGILRNWVKEKIINGFDNLYPICQRAVNKLEKKTGLKAEQVFLGVNNEIVKSISTTFCCKREKPNQKINLTELKDITQKVQQKSLNKIMGARIVSAHITSISVDGNFIANPLGFQGENICLTILSSYTSNTQIDNLLKLASKLKLKLIGIDSSDYALIHCSDLQEVENITRLKDISSLALANLALEFSGAEEFSLTNLWKNFI